MPTNEEVRASRMTQKQGWEGGNPLDQYETFDGYLVIQLGVTMTATYEPDPVKALKAVADREDRFLQPCVRVRTKR